MVCPNCGAALENYDAFCPGCGKADEKSRRHPDCRRCRKAPSQSKHPPKKWPERLLSSRRSRNPRRSGNRKWNPSPPPKNPNQHRKQRSRNHKIARPSIPPAESSAQKEPTTSEPPAKDPVKKRLIILAVVLGILALASRSHCGVLLFKNRRTAGSGSEGSDGKCRRSGNVRGRPGSADRLAATNTTSLRPTTMTSPVRWRI